MVAVYRQTQGSQPMSTDGLKVCSLLALILHSSNEWDKLSEWLQAKEHNITLNIIMCLDAVGWAAGMASGL